MHFYVFIDDPDPKWRGIPIYERTCGNMRAALACLKGRKGFVSVDSVPQNFWY